MKLDSYKNDPLFQIAKDQIKSRNTQIEDLQDVSEDIDVVEDTIEDTVTVTPRKIAIPEESLVYNLKPLSEAQISLLFSRINKTNRSMISREMIWESNKEPEGKKQSLMQKVIGKNIDLTENITKNITASDLMKSWKKTRHSNDSDSVADFLLKQGINSKVIAETFTDMHLPPPGKGKLLTELAEIKKELQQLEPDSQRQITEFLRKTLGVD